MVRSTVLFISIVTVSFLTGCVSFDKMDKIAIEEQHDGAENRLESINGTYKLSPPDSLFISVSDNTDLTTSVTIRPDGNIFFSLLCDFYL